MEMVKEFVSLGMVIPYAIRNAKNCDRIAPSFPTTPEPVPAESTWATLSLYVVFELTFAMKEKGKAVVIFEAAAAAVCDEADLSISCTILLEVSVIMTLVYPLEPAEVPVVYPAVTEA